MQGKKGMRFLHPVKKRSSDSLRTGAALHKNARQIISLQSGETFYASPFLVYQNLRAQKLFFYHLRMGLQYFRGRKNGLPDFRSARAS